MLMCGGRLIYVVVEVRRPSSWACGAAGQLFKACPGKNLGPQPKNSKQDNNKSRERIRSVDGSGEKGHKCGNHFAPADAETAKE